MKEGFWGLRVLGLGNRVGICGFWALVGVSGMVFTVCGFWVRVEDFAFWRLFCFHRRFKNPLLA